VPTDRTDLKRRRNRRTNTGEEVPIALFAVKAVADGVALQFAGLSVGAGPDHKAAMLFISRSTEPFRVRDLPELHEKQQIELARSLIVSGFLVPLSDN
jgi:hypothetical protein